MQDIVHVKIRPHLVSFLYQELEGETQAVYGEKKVKLAKVSRSSLLGQMIDAFKTMANQTSVGRLRSFSVFLTINENGVNTGLFHEKHDRDHKILELKKEHVILVNELLESMFRISAVEFIKGYANNSTSHKFVDEAIEQFMIMHNLYDTTLDPETIRRFYYNSLKKNCSLSRLQNQIGNRSQFYYSA
jgi:hypothetical protein